MDNFKTKMNILFKRATEIKEPHELSSKSQQKISKFKLQSSKKMNCKAFLQQ
jgi:hypothetical protein